MESWSDSRSCRERGKLGAKFESKNSSHPRAAERAGERFLGGRGACSPLARFWGRRRWKRFARRQGGRLGRMAERFGGAVKSRDQLVLL